MAPLNSLVLLFFSGLFSVVLTTLLKEKRILLSDLNYLQQELHQIQVKLQDYEATKNQIPDLLSKITSQETDILSLQSKLADAEMEVSTLKQNFDITQKSVSTLQSELSVKNSEIVQLQTTVSNQERELSVLQSTVTAQGFNLTSIRSELSADKSHIVSLEANVSTSLSQMSGKLSGQETEITYLKSQIQHNPDNTGTVYTRWGRRDCPADNGTHLVYSGYAGGSNSAKSGGAADMMCLPNNPTWGPHKETPPYNPAYMYGAEYEDALLFSMPNQDEDVPCAVCRSSYHSTSIMIPAREQCYPDWVEAYHGVLSAGSNGSPSPTQFICVDGNPQALTGGAINNSEGRLLYQVRTVCGSLQCPPYENDKVLSCVVCLK